MHDLFQVMPHLCLAISESGGEHAYPCLMVLAPLACANSSNTSKNDQ